MRDDLTERFILKRGSKHKRYPRNTKEHALREDDAGSVQGMRKAHLGNWYYGIDGIGADFSVMRRILQSKIGQPWDSVFSEICEHADLRTYAGHHLRNWLEYLVEQNCTIEHGEILDNCGRRLGNFRRDFYVHPETKLLSVIEDHRRWRPKAETQKVFELDGQLFHNHDGIWYRVEMEVIPDRPIIRYQSWPHRVQFHSELKDAILQFGFEDDYKIAQRLKKEYGLSPDKKLWYCKKKESANGREIDHLKKKYPELA